MSSTVYWKHPWLQYHWELKTKPVGLTRRRKTKFGKQTHSLPEISLLFTLDIDLSSLFNLASVIILMYKHQQNPEDSSPGQNQWDQQLYSQYNQHTLHTLPTALPAHRRMHGDIFSPMGKALGKGIDQRTFHGLKQNDVSDVSKANKWILLHCFDKILHEQLDMGCIGNNFGLFGSRLGLFSKIIVLFPLHTRTVEMSNNTLTLWQCPPQNRSRIWLHLSSDISNQNEPPPFREWQWMFHINDQHLSTSPLSCKQKLARYITGGVNQWNNG